MSQIAFYVPVAMDPKILPREHRQYAAYFLNLLHWKWICWQADRHGFVHLKSSYLMKIIPPDVWPKLWRRLHDLDVIEIDFHVAVGRKALGYRLAESFRKTKRIICRDEELAERIRRVYAEESGPDLPVLRWLGSGLGRLRIDRRTAVRVIGTLRPRSNSGMCVGDYRRQLIEHCKRIYRGDHYLHCDRFGRAHTLVTNLPRELRCALRLDGEPLVGFDLANSQPLILGLLACQYHGSRMRATRLRQRVFRAGRPPYHRRSLTAAATDRPDLKQYLEVCEAGTLYESLMGPGDDRERIKRQFLTAIYGRNSWKSSLWDVLERGYPSVAEMLRGVKKTNFRHAAHLAQNAEATLFIYETCGYLMNHHPTVPVVTVHDSILTTRKHLPVVRAALERTFGRLGVDPLLKQESHK